MLKIYLYTKGELAAAVPRFFWVTDLIFNNG